MPLALPLPEPHANQVVILDSTTRFRVVVCGRRFGKTVLGEHAILTRVIRDHDACWWLAPTYDMADHVWRDLKAAVRPVPGVQISESDLRIDFPKGGWLAIHSTHTPDHLRGAGLDFVVLDEAAFMTPDIWPEIVRPMLVERKGRALFLSSPNGKNWFYQLYLLGLKTPSARRLAATTAPSEGFSPPLYAVRPKEVPVGERGLGGEDAEGRRANDLKLGTLNNWRAFHFSTAQNPLITPGELDAIRAETPERIWREEYEAEFTDDLGQVFRGIREAATAPVDVEPNPGARYVCGLDWGRENDYTAIVVMDVERRALVAIDRFNQVSWSLQRGRLKAMCDRWQPAVIYAESNSIGSPNIEALQAEGLPVRPFVTSATSKPPLIEALSLAIERRDIALLPDESLLAELSVYTMQRLPAGGYHYSAPSGLHDDLVIATALAWYAARHSSLPISFA
jgi:terminase large subunit-like protein